MIGRTLSHCKVFEEVSRGGTGIVYRAVDTHLDREVTVEILALDLVGDPKCKRRIAHEPGYIQSRARLGDLLRRMRFAD